MSAAYANAPAEFADALCAAGFRLRAGPVMDGQMHRAAVEGDKSGERSGEYRGYLDGIPAGFFINHRTGQQANWKADAALPAMSAAEHEAVQRKIAAANAARKRQDAVRRDAIARDSVATWEAAAPVPEDHPYTPPGGAWRQQPRQGGRRGPPQSPSPFAPDAEWRAWRRTRRAALPPWAFDADWLTSHALEVLPMVAGQLGLGDALCMLPRPRWWFGPSLHAEAAALHRAPLPDLLPVLVLRLQPSASDLLFVDMSLGEWDCPNLSRRGSDLVSLAAWRWSLTPAKAAWSLARTLGLGGPMP